MVDFTAYAIDLIFDAVSFYYYYCIAAFRKIPRAKQGFRASTACISGTLFVEDSPKGAYRLANSSHDLFFINFLYHPISKHP